MRTVSLSRSTFGSLLASVVSASVASTLLLAASQLVTNVARADTLRCGQRLVTDGDTLYEVRTRCGEPVSALRRTEYRTVRLWVAGRAVEQSIEISIDEWIYDFGPHRFVQHLTFEQGKLITVVSGHRGEKSEPAPTQP